ncbi:MAG: LysR family transcriptional regulator [Proteobacteria bacterium]|nr:MAG: LysR family transcriptional regulator [Pseudomonadota bacterium]
MDTNRLKYFSAVAETGSVRRAADILRVSPPSLSKAIHHLEEELGLKLFIRAGRNIRLTDSGQRFALRTKEVLRGLDELRLSAEEEKTPVQEIRIATFEVFSTHFLQALAGPDWENIPFTVHDVLPGELERALVDRHVDVGITYMPVPHPDLDYLKVASVEMAVFAAKGAFPGMEQPELPFVVPVNPLYGSPSRVRGLDGWPDDAYPRNVRYKVTLLESALQLCRQGKAAGYFPSFVVNAHNAHMVAEYQLVRRATPYKGRECRTDVFLVKRKSDVENRTMKLLGKAIRLYTKK